MEDVLIDSAVNFGRSALGLVIRPYETYRRIVNRGNLWELLYVLVGALAYFALASLVKASAFRPFLLTKQFVVLTGSAVFTFAFVVWLFWFISGVFGRKGKLAGFVVSWGYTLVPTLLWFLATSLLYVILPPPRTTQWTGMLFSALYLIFSVTLLLWKVTLGYLAIRFGMKMDLPKIVGVCLIAIPILALYSFGMYRLGIFRIPFL